MNVFDLLILLTTFLYGNLFAIQNCVLHWNFPVFIYILATVEFFNKIIYFLQEKKDVQSTRYFFFTKKNKDVWRNPNFYLSNILNTVKRGFLLGFFVEAFKVGS
uniref:Uncharacterized protein n=1 Tax=Chlorella vulgaris TaxID=3077 RepID=V9H0X9_CHLVU|nr:hypothetical protein ChvulCp013 [Chlorella vulgaris]pir/T07201/ hypothetical protein 103 - Chlorella vulgaris chloroplast [Chlorella vulgaris]BAA57848.1 unnamed protein product [Chlorella vulgaris]